MIDLEDLIRLDKEYVLNTYKRIELEISHASGSYIYDTSGNKYLDMFTGISVNNLGNSVKEIVERICSQSQRYIHLSNYFASRPVVDLARHLVENSFASKVFFTNSGTESSEAALKLVKKYGLENKKNRILTAKNSFHGRSTGGIALTGQDKYQSSFRPLIPDIHHFEFNNIKDLKSMVDEETSAVFLEMIQGEGGLKEISDEFMAELLKLREKYGFLIVIDEIQTGLGRSSDLFAYEKFNFSPDLVCLAKSLGGGLPLGALLVSKELENMIGPGDHGSTFGGNPVAASAGCYVLERLTGQGFLDDLKRRASYLMEKLTLLKDEYPHIINEIRGRGMMVGLEVSSYAGEIKEEAIKDKLLLNVTSQTVIRLLPSLEISESEIDEFYFKMNRILGKIKD